MEMINDYIKAGAIAPFDDFLTAEDRDNFHYLDKGVLTESSTPCPIVVGSARVMFYNKAILKEAGVQSVPETWDNLRMPARRWRPSARLRCFSSGETNPKVP